MQTVEFTLSAPYRNPNPPHVYDPSDRELASDLEAMLQLNMANVVRDAWLNTENRTGLLQRDSFRGEEVVLGVRVRSSLGDRVKWFLRYLSRTFRRLTRRI